MADTQKKASIVIGKLTMFKDGVVRAGRCENGDDRCGIKILFSTLVENEKATSQGWETKHTRRIGFHFNLAPPVWWSARHMASLHRWIADNDWQLRTAAMGATRGNLIDVPEKHFVRRPDSVGRIGMEWTGSKDWKA